MTYQQPYDDESRYYSPQPQGKFDTKKLAINLTILGVLCAVITFAVVIVTDLIVSTISGWAEQGPAMAILVAIVAGLVGVCAGLLYIPVVGTGNENLFGVAILALTAAAIIVWVLFGGLLDGDWETILTLVAVICAGSTAYIAPRRIESARLR
ncbi:MULTISPECIES: hypothetical protein [Corynebacterium]|uniref:Uncharacterized protein n=1 Tax=Corynebacterium flavescens TaxID=28028 RepID=A0AB73B6W8_CORFL|nr:MULTISPECIES: hypothetical protein [Corynebacterium]KAA8723852.1 hypothetical protein F4V60_03585 [Corynebacterium flavescens]MDN6100349.1 hypothetical protein [Corynebacterium flavescens]MDN6198977.1 hypothetical protein [Corynebacterium flavescens]MDN6225967.1 hypothetical protein [Corynebacterium flavescens]MDN6236258.1 hypothetical protein [Corynebacterium flavescens]